MLIDIASDLHLARIYDLGDSFYTAEAPVLALVGDVCEVRQLRKMMPVFRRMSETWETVLYILGNHEFYYSCLDSTSDYIKEELSCCNNIHVLDNESITLDDVTIVGSTLWSDMDRNNPLTKQNCKTGISDYFFIAHSLKDGTFRSRSILPDDTVSLFNKNTDFIEQEVKKTSGKMIILTHHAPSYQSISPQFKTSTLNGAFASNLEHIMVDNPNVKLWVHGHCHSDNDYMVNQCRVISRPKGYYGELYGHSHDYVPLTVEI